MYLRESLQYTYVHTYIHMYICMCTHIDIYIHTYIHMKTHVTPAFARNKASGYAWISIYLCTHDMST